MAGEAFAEKESVEGARRALALVGNAHRAYGVGNVHRAEWEMPTGHIGGHGGKPTGRADDHMSYGAQHQDWECPPGI